MSIRDFMKKMNVNTTQRKKTYFEPEDIREDTPDDEPPEGWIYMGPIPEYPDESNYSRMLQQIKKEFSVIAIQMITMHPRIIDIPTATDEAVELKRRGEYLKSSRYYADYLRDNRVLTPMMAMGWFKTLAAGGDTRDAISLAENFFDSNPPNCYATNMLKQHMNTLKRLSADMNRRELLQYLQSLSGNPNYCVVAMDIDIFAEVAENQGNDEEVSDDYGVTIRQHWGLVEELLVHSAAIKKIIAGHTCILTPADHCYLFTDPMEQDGMFVVAARLQVDEIIVHLCIEQDVTTGKFSSFLVGIYGRTDGLDIDPILKQYISTVNPDLPIWIKPYIFDAE